MDNWKVVEVLDVTNGRYWKRIYDSVFARYQYTTLLNLKKKKDMPLAVSIRSARPDDKNIG